MTRTHVRHHTALRGYAAAVRAAGADVEHLAPSAARRRFPALRFTDDAEIESLGIERCVYTMTPTEGFVIDHWPGDPRVAFASACSGHGFKFAPLTGRILAELVVNGRADLPKGAATASLFALRRTAVPGADAPT